MNAAPDLDHKLREVQREYLDFLDDEEDQGIYHTKAKNMIEEKEVRIIISINDLRKKNPKRATELLLNSFEEQIAFQRALQEFIGSIDGVFASEHEEFFISFEGSFGNRHVTPRTLTSRLLGNMICVEGIVTKCSMVFPKIVRSVHYCPATGKTIERRYTDLTSIDAFPSSSVYPTTDDDGNVLETEYGLSVYKDHQTLTIQEMPEKAPAGQLPRSVDIVCDNDLVDICCPGDRVQIVGNYRCLPAKKGSFTSGTFRSILIANRIQQLSKDSMLYVTRDDVMKCRKLSKKPDIFELLSKSLAPSIHGHEYVKKAILCMLLGGVEKILPNGTRLRGDINILLVGDPSVAKSQLLRYVLCTAPRAIPTTGRGSTGVGLTAAVTTDQESGERRLEAGAMVLADRGVVCIDEFDKMSDIDRTAIHEVMEQGRVTISKAGIHARLNARCSVLAAANPVYGKYDQYRAPMENIGLQDSLLSRFDLLFVMLDVIDASCDRSIGDHVVRMHRYRNPGEPDGEVLKTGSGIDSLSTHETGEAEVEGKNVRIFEKYDSLLHGSSRARTDKILTIQFMRKYIHVAKVLKPVLTEEASELIAEEYSRLRSQDAIDLDVARTQPVTVRTLETLIRLSTAHAKARLKRFVEVVDAQAAIELVQFAYFKRVLEKPKKKRSHDTEAREEVDSDEERQPAKKTREDTEDTYTFSTETDSEEVAQLASGQSAPVDSAPMDIVPFEITSDRLKILKSCISKAFEENNKQPLNISNLLQHANNKYPDDLFSQSEMMAGITKLQEENVVFLSDNILFLLA